MAYYIIILTSVMMIAGLFGGLINYYQMNQDQADPSNLPRSIVIGIGATFLVPLFLYLMKSDLILEIQGDPTRLMIYTGICLFAAIGSRVVIVNNTERLLHEAAMTRELVASLQHELRSLQEELLPLIETETEQDFARDESLPPVAQDELDVTSSQVLKTLGCGRFIFRSLAGLCREAELDENTMTKTLNVLVARNLAGKISGSKGVRWYLSERGRRAMDQLI